MRIEHSTLKVLRPSALAAEKLDGLTIGVHRLEITLDADGLPFFPIELLDHKRAIWNAIKEKFPNVTVQQIKNNFTIVPYVYDDEVE